MPVKMTVRTAQVRFDNLYDEVVGNQRVVIICRPGKPSVALISADELSVINETLHLLGSAKNVERLLQALRRARSTA